MGPMVFDSGKKQMLVMTPPINTFRFKIDAIEKLLRKSAGDEKNDPHAFDQVFLDTLNSLTAEVLLYFQNRLHLSTGKEASLRSMPIVKAQYRKKLAIEISELIGDKGYLKLKALDQQRGSTQHKNERYFMNHRVGGQDLSSIPLLISYVGTISSLITEFDEKMDAQFPVFQKTITKDGSTRSIEYQATTHSYDLKKGKVNPK